MRLRELRDIAESQVGDVEELVGLLELTIEDILDRFPDALMENKEKFGVSDPEE